MRPYVPGISRPGPAAGLQGGYGYPRGVELHPGGFVDTVYRLFDRRCRTETALAKLARLRRRVQR
jgi:hypothetical protein